MSSLQREVDTYHQLLPSLLTQQGKFALIRGDDLVGTFDSYPDALSAGYEKFKLDRFLVKQIAVAEQVLYFGRELTRCPA